MIIERIETFQNSHIAVVRVTGADGDLGIGQTAPYEVASTVAVLHEIVAPFFLGRNAWDAEALVDEFLRMTYKFPSSFLLRAMGGIETALWDMMARRAGQPVWRLLGGAARTSVPVYASSMRRDTSPETEAERIAGFSESHGFRAAKIRVGEPMGRDGEIDPGRTRRIIPLMRETVGSDFLLSADANGGYTVSEAIRIGRMLEENDYFHFEEPCPFPDIGLTARVTDALDIAVSGGEQDTNLAQFHRIISERAVDIIQPDVGYLGGVSRTRKVAVLAEAAGIPCTPHCANSSLLQIFTLHVALAMPACIHPQEWSIEETPWTQDIFGPVPQVVDGRVSAPSGPGWGIEIERGFLSRAVARESRI